MKSNYPFTAIVGQERLKKALLLCAINPGIGGLLIQGDKGTAKSTAARALAEVIAAPFVNLPLGATEERVLGSIDLEAVLVEKKKKFQPGLLSAVHGGILYIDEVNLLSDHLVDVLLDVAASGENIIERDGLSFSHASRFTLIGTMNPEEGQLRPQFLDRFGLMFHVEAPVEVAERTEVVRHRIAFENDPVAFIKQWEAAQQVLQQQVFKAKELLPAVQLNDDLLTMISQLTTSLQVKSLRADIVMYKTAITIAALDQRSEVNEADINEAAELALAHRSRKNPFAEPPASPKPQQSKEAGKKEPGKNENNEPLKKNQAPQQNQTSYSGREDKAEDRPDKSKDHPNETSNDEDPGGDQIDTDEDVNGKEQNQGGNIAERLFGVINPVTLPKIEGYISKSEQAPLTGRRSSALNLTRGKSIGAEPAKNAKDIAIEATVLHAILRNPEELNITINDLHQKKRSSKISNLILFVVDASGSMAASKRMEAVKGTVFSLLQDAYQKRDTVGVIAFRGIAAQVLLQPTQSIERAEEAMRTLPTGGRTPLPHALQTTIQLLQQYDQKGYHPIVVMLTDGKANVALGGESDPWHQSLVLAAQLKKMNIKSLVLNTESNYFNLDKAAELAVALGGQYQSLDDISEEHLTPLISHLL
ncbi:magnesium chelatase subunit D family protein [Pedobacter sp. L105]|uniref:magnesium chelatase subunit D family protein n=1 Tax=Pedobacter sp. L105 TaxID=1641871 RepID=UPI00131BFFF1|nr:magnesium chelatase subunit D family protein [Pedobacter sp. L105]